MVKPRGWTPQRKIPIPGYLENKKNTVSITKLAWVELNVMEENLKYRVVSACISNAVKKHDVTWLHCLVIV